MFRGKFLDGLERLRARGLLGDHLDDRAARRRRARLYDTSWVVYAKRPFGGAQQVYRYLGRYTHRVAISNARLVTIDDDAVVFRTRGQDTATMSPVEFIRRFLSHRLPRGFVKIRHGGLLSPANVNASLVRAKALLCRDKHRTADPPGGITDAARDADRPDVAKVADQPWPALLLALTGIDLAICPACGSRAMVRVPLPLPPDCRGPPATTTIN